MPSRQIAMVSAVLFFVGASSCGGQDVSPSYAHLKFLEPFIGQRQVMETKEGKTKAAGIEDATWMLNKSCVQHVGWGEFEGKPIRYGFVTGWNAKSKEIFQWGAGANHLAYAFEQRSGTYDPATKTWNAKAQGFVSNDLKYTNDVKLTAVNDNTMTLDFAQGLENGKKVPDVHVVFSPQVDIAAPTFDETPGPGYEKLKPIEWMVGDWQVEGKWGDGKVHAGEEHAEWIFNKNFILGQGWFTDRDAKRVEYMYLVVWDPNSRKIVMPILDSFGGHFIRTGDLAAATNTVTSRQAGILGTGEETSLDQVSKLIDRNSYEWTGTNVKGPVKLPDIRITFSRK